MKSFSRFFVFFVLLFVVWLLLNASMQTQVVWLGIVVAGVLAFIFTPRLEVFFGFSFTPKSIFYFIRYIFVFLIALLKSNLDVAFRVLAPRVRINPGVVEIKTKLKSPMARLILANSITLTPGTLSIDIQGDTLFIHWIDVSSSDIEGATREIAEGFEKYLEVIYGR